ncbi:MAG TPA: DNA repair protein RadA [Phycisphaerales bacterium]|nr:DNA repair protein RadA [Phycisphaerales bacterium]
MAKVRKVWVCRSCGASQARWMGKCPDCGTWDSLEETTLDKSATQDPQKALTWAWQQTKEGGAALLAESVEDGVALGAQPIGKIDIHAAPVARMPSGIAELDRVLGVSGDAAAGLVPGSAVLVGGEPGIGKSTLLLQAAHAWAAKGVKVLYVSSEESAQQVAMRSARLRTEGADHASTEARPSADESGSSSSLFLLHDTNLARIVEQARKVAPRILIIDSVQMIYRSDVSAAPGSITQLRRCCAELVYLAKAAHIAVVLVGHVTKDGQLAGPRLLEHLVDTVLSFEGDRTHQHRVVRAIKNRFGTTQEIGLFEMTGFGLREVPQGASLAALGSLDHPRPGSAVCPVMTGSRSILVEVQALTATGFLGAAKRKCSGLDPNRLAMIIAVLEQHAELRLADRDIFASSVGGLRITDPASDLAVLLAIAGAHFRRPMPARSIAVGEVGLGGEVRTVPYLEQRIREAVRLGCTRVLAAAPQGKARLPSIPGAEVVPLRTINDAIAQLG